MKVCISVHGRFHAFALARELHDRNALARLITTYPATIARKFFPSSVPLKTAPWLEILRRAHARFFLPGNPDLWIARQFGRFAASRLPEDADILVGWSGATLEAIAPARNRGMKVVLERGSLHIETQTEVLREEYARWGLPWRGTDPRLIARECAEYEAADSIAVGSRASARSFMARGIPESRLIVNPYGVALPPHRAATDRARPREGRIRILFVGQVGLRKGVPNLLQAFARLRDRADLHLIGPLEPGFDRVLRRLPLESVTLRGPLPGNKLGDEYERADIFCLPSLEEGFGMVVLEAMAAGCPVVASSATGLADLCASEADAGLLVPAGNADALSQALERLMDDSGHRSRLSEGGRRAVAGGFSWSDYGTRAIAAYSELLR